jgi:hypothetical protein
MTLIESSVNDATIWSITLDLPIMTLKASFALICDVYNTSVNYYDHNVECMMEYQGVARISAQQP